MPILGTSVYANECSSSICDENGNLLFYAGQSFVTGGLEAGVFNKYNKLIQNGTGIYCNTSSTQGNLLVPYVADTNLIYLITHRSAASIPDYKYYYSIINKSANSDSGAVILKNQFLPSIGNMSEQLQVIRHGNGIDWWLITHKGNGNQYYIYLIDSSGINGPFVQSIGSPFPLFSAVGQMKISPDGKRLALVDTFGHIDLFDFDRCTGLLSNFISLGYNTNNSVYEAYYGCSFSSNSQKLYVSGEDTLLQFDLLAPVISSSKQVIWNDNDTINTIGQHLLGPDGKIYISYWYFNSYNFQNMNLSVINSPDSLGSACDFQPYSFNLGGRRSFAGLPNIPDYNLVAVEPPCDSIVSVTEVPSFDKNAIVYPNPANNFISLNLRIGKVAEVKIYDIVGKLIKQEVINNKNEIDVSELHSGIYFIKITNDKQKFVTKFVKQ